MPEDDGRFETTRPLMRASYQNAVEAERNRLKEMLRQPPHIANFDRASTTRQLRRIESQLESEAPKPYAREKLDAAKRREAELAEKIQLGMPTDREQRTTPPGNLDKHMNWERRNKQDILEWKNIRRRLASSGDLDDVSSMVDVGNVENLRRREGGPNERVGGGPIQSQEYHLAPQIESRNHMSDEDRWKLMQDTADAIRASGTNPIADRTAAKRIEDKIREERAELIIEREGLRERLREQAEDE